MFGKSKPEIIRTCSRCGGWRYILRSDQRKRPVGKFEGWCDKQIRSSSGTLTSYRLEQDRLRQLVTCGQCGSQSFTDKPAPPVSK